MRNLACLSEKLKKLRIPLLVREAPTFADAPDVLLKLAGRLNCDAIYFNREHEVHEQRRDAAVTKVCQRAGISVRAFDDQTIVPPDIPRTKSGGFYTVFTPFKRAWTACLLDRGAEPCPTPRRQPEWVCAPDAIPESVGGVRFVRGPP